MKLFKEEWKDIKGFEGLYQVSNCGNVKSLDRVVQYCENSKSITNKHTVKGKDKEPSIKDNGYLTVSLYKNNKKYHKYIHRLVAEAFIENPEGLATVNHKNFDKQDNYFTNLEWCSYGDNNDHARKNKKFKSGKAIKIEATNIDTGKKQIITDLLSWCKQNNHDRACVYRVLSGRYAHHHRLNFRYID